MARTLDREPKFWTINVAPTHFPPACVVRSTDPFIKSADQPANQSTPTPSDLHSTHSSAAKHQSTSKSCTDQAHSDGPRALDVSTTDPPVLHRQTTSQASTEPIRKGSFSSMESDVESELWYRPPVDIYVEEGELLDQDQDVTVAPRPISL